MIVSFYADYEISAMDFEGRLGFCYCFSGFQSKMQPMTTDLLTYYHYSIDIS